METRTCARCGEGKPLDADNFYRNKAQPKGLSHWCRPCVRSYMAFRPWKRPNRTKNHTVWEHERIEQGICIKCSEPASSSNKQFCDYHLMQVARRRQIRTIDLRIKAMQTLGGLVCVGCGETEYIVLTLDHIDGYEPELEIKTETLCLRIIEGRYHDKIRVLCCNCQTRNEYRRGNRAIDDLTTEKVLTAGGKVVPVMLWSKT